MKSNARCFLFLVLTLSGLPAVAAEPATEESKLQSLMQASLDWYKVLPKPDASEPLKPQVVLSWRNTVRGEQAKDLLALWVDNGRPVAFASLFPWDGKLCHEFGALTRAAGLVARDADAVVWSPRTGGVEFRNLSDAPVPADSPALRLRQMKALAERFTATLIGWKANDAGPEQLRLLPKPVYRYEVASPSRAHPDLLDGVLMAFVQGTDPEVLLMIEAVASDDGPRWQYGFSRATSGSLESKLGDVIVWQVDEFSDAASPASPFIVLRRKIENGFAP